MRLVFKFKILLFLLTLITFSGCLSTEYKEYVFKINPDGSGEGEIKFHNIISVEDDEKDVSFKDFGELVSDYMEGTSFEDENPGYNVTSKEIFELDSVLAGKVIFTFDDITEIGFFKYEDCECSPLMFYMGDFGETYSESNGKYYGDEKDFPVVFWNAGTTEIRIKTFVQEDLTDTHSLLKLYKTWKDTK